MINWIAKNTTTAAFSKKHTCHITSSLLQHALTISASSSNANM